MGCFYPKPGISTKEYFREFISHRCPYFFIYGAAKPPQNLSKRGRILKYLPNEWLNCWVIPWLPSLQSQVNNRNCPDTECSREMSKIWGAGSGWAACLRRHEAERTWGRIPGGETELKECSKLMKDPLCNQSTWIGPWKTLDLKGSEMRVLGFRLPERSLEMRNSAGNITMRNAKQMKWERISQPWAAIPKETHWIPLPQFLTGKNGEKTLGGKSLPLKPNPCFAQPQLQVWDLSENSDSVHSLSGKVWLCLTQTQQSWVCLTLIKFNPGLWPPAP